MWSALEYLNPLHGMFRGIGDETISLKVTNF